MKKLKYLIIALVVSSTVLSCEFLDKEPDTEVTIDLVFNTKSRTEEWLAGCYSLIPDPYKGYAQTLGWEILGDDMTPSERYKQWSWDVINKITGDWSTVSKWDGDYWAAIPKKLRTIYIFLDNVKALPEQKLYASEVELMKAECRFLVAYYYYLWVDVYGAIPFTPYVISDLSDTDSGNIPQAPFDQVIEWCASEMVEAAKSLPAVYTEASKYGRITSVMCYAARARMLLFAASDLVNGNPDYAGFTNSEGTPIFNSSKDDSKWVRATQACKDLLDLAHSAGHGLYYEYNDDGTIDPFMSYYNMMFVEHSLGNPEILWARPDSDYKDYEKVSAPRGNKGGGGYGVTQSLVDAFFMSNGMPIKHQNSGYVDTGFSSSDGYWSLGNTKWADVKGNPGQVTLSGTYNMYCNREPRFYISVYFNNQYLSVEDRPLDFTYLGTDNDGTHDSPQNGYLVRKKCMNDRDLSKSYYTWRPGILFRMGEAYLNYIEALNESDPGNSDIIYYLNLIRERAGIPEYTGTYSQSEMRELIRMERRVELNCEGIRYNDLRRWKKAHELLNGDFYGMNFYGIHPTTPENTQEFYQLTAYQTRVYPKKYYWFPIHQDEIDKAPNLVQTPFWNN